MAPFTSYRYHNLRNDANIAFCMVAQVMVACERRHSKLKFEFEFEFEFEFNGGLAH